MAVVTEADSTQADQRQTEALLAAAIGAVPQGMDRPGQRMMARAVTEAVHTGEHLLVQAGTGTGKSLAYLVPALATGKRVVVTTATLALQAQLVNHDLPRLVEAAAPVLGRTPTFALLKGRHHYACRARLEPGAADDDDGLFETDTQWLGAAGKLVQQVTRVREWAAEETDTGDRADLDPGVDDSAWRQVSMPARECVGAARCPFGEECFAEAARAKARQADIVVTNHSLLAVDLLSGRHIVPEHALLVIDEAHELTDRVTSAAQAELNAEVISRAARRLRSFVPDKLRDDVEGSADLLERMLDGARPGRLERLPEPLYDALFLVDSAARAALDALGGEVGPEEADAVKRNQAKQGLTGLVDTVERLLEQSDRDVAWVAQEDRRPPALNVAPLSVSAALGSGLFRDRVVVAASATLALGGRFDTVARSLGLEVDYGRTPETGDVRRVEPPVIDDDDDKEPPAVWRALDVGSPFDYPKQGILYVASRLPKPGMSGLSEAAQRELVELVTAAGGRTLGLFSSRKAASTAAEALRAQTDLPVLLQGDDSIHLLVRRFKEEPQTCLLGVASLWQGVDVPGDACQLVVIDRLPFPRPDEPLTAARSKAVDDAGGSGFMAVSVPAAAIRLSQGAGRLIRAAGDRGVVAVLDARLHNARYGEFIRRTLPPFWYTTSPDVVRGALKRLGGTAET
nr:ATP-dependent DNA helicase [Cryptosporangium arvum]